jgi:hypothetical protein
MFFAMFLTHFATQNGFFLRRVCEFLNKIIPIKKNGSIFAGDF